MVTLVKSYLAAQEAAKTLSYCAIECEYGNHAITEEDDGIIIALNHHGKYSKNEPPCMIFNSFLFNKKNKNNNFLISHVDLDVIMGALWLSDQLKITPEISQICELIKETDLYGFHITEKKLDSLDPVIKYKFLGMGYILNSFSFLAPETTNDITHQFKKASLEIKNVLINDLDLELCNKVDLWLKQKLLTSEKYLKKEFLSEKYNVGFYIAPFGLTTAYKRKNYYFDIIIQYNEQSRSVSLSTFNESIAINIFGETGVQKPLKEFFGEDAGGRISIGGTPRNSNYHPEMSKAFLDYLNREYFNFPTVLDINNI